MKWVLPLAMAFSLAFEARAQENPPLTFDALFALSPHDAAARVFGPTPEVFVERSPWDHLKPDFVRGNAAKLQMELFTTPVRIAPSVCATTMGWAVFDMGWPEHGSDEAKIAWSKLPYTQRPLSLDRWDRQREYFAVGPAPATPAEPGGKPITPGKAALAKNSCANPVALRGRFTAPSDEAAILLVSSVIAAAAAATRAGPLPFKMDYSCSPRPIACRPRQELAKLKMGWLSDFDEDEGCKSWRNTGLAGGAKRCIRFDFDEAKIFDSFVFVLGKSDKLLQVWLGTKPWIEVPPPLGAPGSSSRQP